MLICFFDQEGIVHREFVPPGMTVNADFYCDVLRRLHENLWRKGPQKWQNQNLIIHHDNAPAHMSFKVSQFLAKNNMNVIPPSPILTQSGPLWLFPLLQAEASDEGLKIRRHWKDSRGIAAGTWHNSKKGLPRMLPSMAESVFVQKGSTLKVMEEFNIQGKQTSFYKYCPGTFGYILVSHNRHDSRAKLLYTKCLFWFSLQLLTVIFRTLRST